MLKLMIVDDEFFVRRGIAESIDWSTYGIHICGEAADGEEALASGSDLRPDIILTDIKMGRMDGLEFITKCQEILPQAKFIILSGHDDFEYARRAISLGVCEYLLKPIGAEELIGSITKLKEHIQQEKEKQSVKESSIQSSMMLSWNIPQSSLPIETSWFQVFMFSVDNPRELSFGSFAHKASHSIYNIPLLVQDYFNMANINHIVKKDYDNIYMIMLNYPAQRTEPDSVVSCLREYMYKKCNAQITLGIGRQYQGYHRINQSYSEAFSALGYKYAFPYAVDIDVKKVPCSLVRSYMNNTWIHTFKTEILAFSRLCDAKPGTFDKLLERLAVKIEQQKLELEEIKTLCLKICILCLNSLDNKAYSQMERQRIIALMNMDSTQDKKCVYGQMGQIICIMEHASNSSSYGNYQNMIDVVVQYVHSHYGDNLSLHLLAGIIHVTPNYLSRIFKETVGENFKEWLTRYRIEKSKELLLDSSMRMYEIATLVGFSDYKHFSSTFKRCTGYSAKEYRISILKRQ